MASTVLREAGGGDVEITEDGDQGQAAAMLPLYLRWWQMTTWLRVRGKRSFRSR
jgi:hypothetical protein